MLLKNLLRDVLVERDDCDCDFNNETKKLSVEVINEFINFPYQISGRCQDEYCSVHKLHIN